MMPEAIYSYYKKLREKKNPDNFWSMLGCDLYSGEYYEYVMAFI